MHGMLTTRHSSGMKGALNASIFEFTEVSCVTLYPPSANADISLLPRGRRTRIPWEGSVQSVLETVCQ